MSFYDILFIYIYLLIIIIDSAEKNYLIKYSEYKFILLIIINNNCNKRNN
jgi:hypothetical protein